MARPQCDSPLVFEKELLVSPITNKKKTKKIPPSPPPKTQKKKSPVSLLIGCMNFLFPNQFAIIFNLD
jgi:hypothetical protein